MIEQVIKQLNDRLIIDNPTKGIELFYVDGKHIKLEYIRIGYGEFQIKII